MVKFGDIKPDKLKILSVMFTMAIETLFSLYLSRRMVTFGGRYSLFNLGVACHAFIIRNLIPENMALGTIGDSFKLGMRI
jgi:hypothetical protein